MFRNLLSSAEKRQLELLEQLSNGDGCTMEELSSILHYSIRTIRTDIDHFRKKFHDLFTIHLSKDNHWSIEENFSLSILQAINRIYQENINVQLLQLVMNNQNMSIEEYARRLHSSYSSLFRNIKTVNKVLKDYELTLVTKPLHIKGEVSQVRYFYSLLFWGVLHKLPDGLTCSYVQEVEKFIDDLSEDSRFAYSMVESEKLFYFMMISLLCIERGEVDETFTPPVSIPYFLEEKLDALFSHFPFVIPKSERDLMGFYILQYYSEKQEILHPPNGISQQLYEEFDKYIHHLTEHTGIRVDKRQAFLSELTWRALYKQSYRGGSFFIEPRIKKSEMASLGLQYMKFIEVANEVMSEYPLLERTIVKSKRTFVYEMATYWDGIFDEMTRLTKKTNVLIISEMGHRHEKFLCTFMEQEYPFDLNCYNQTGKDMPHPDILLTDTYSSDIFDIGQRAKHVVAIDYASMERTLQEVGKIISNDKRG